MVFKLFFVLLRDGYHWWLSERNLMAGMWNFWPKLDNWWQKSQKLDEIEGRWHLSAFYRPTAQKTPLHPPTALVPCSSFLLVWCRSPRPLFPASLPPPSVQVCEWNPNTLRTTWIWRKWFERFVFACFDLAQIYLDHLYLDYNIWQHSWALHTI
jgi:hypothetical protein